jgi:hypothetical protein
MQAYKQKVTVPGDHHIELRLPEDFPPGPAEVIVLSSLSAKKAPQHWIRIEEPHPVLGKIIFHEDPSLPLDPEDWPEDQS